MLSPSQHSSNQHAHSEDTGAPRLLAGVCQVAGGELTHQCLQSPLTLLSSQCSKVDFPPLPFHYRADLQYNILHKERFLRGRCSFSGPDCGEAAPSLHGIPIHELGRSVGFSEVFDGRESREAAKITTMMEFVDHNSDEVWTETE